MTQFRGQKIKGRGHQAA